MNLHFLSPVILKLGEKSMTSTNTLSVFTYFLIGILFYSCGGSSADQSPVEEATRTYPTTGQIQRLDPEMDDQIPDGAGIEVLASGFNWSEGPLWLPEQELLIFSDVPENRIYQWRPGDTTATVYLEPSGFTGDTTRSREPGSNGLALDNEGRLLLCQHGNRQIARMTAPLDKPAPQFATLAGTYDGKRFNSPNDLVVDAAGNIYFTDPPYGLEKGVDDPVKELPFQGVYRLSPDGEVTLLIDTLTRPNGIGLSPDEQTLYVAVSDPQGAWYMAYKLNDDGLVESGGILLDVTPLTAQAQGLPDGLKVHDNGTLFATGPGGVLVISPEGQHLGTIQTGQATANCGFNPDQTMLYMTADSLLLRVPVGNRELGSAE
jgi:gluconolactonase